MTFSALRRLGGGVLVLGLVVGARVHADPTITNDSRSDWILRFSDRAERLEGLGVGNPGYVETPITVTYQGDQQSQTLSRTGRHNAARIEPGQTITLSYKSQQDLAEVVTFRDVDSRTEHCSIFLKGCGPDAHPDGPGAYVVIRLEDHLDQAEHFQKHGIVLKGRCEVHILAPSFARIFKKKLIKSVLSDVPEGASDLSEESKAAPAPPPIPASSQAPS